MKSNTRLGWVLIEQRNFEGALNRFDIGTTRPPLISEYVVRGGAVAEPHMGSAVALWLARQKDEALNQFSLAVGARPEWLNPRWTTALYSHNVTTAVAEMQAEHKKRKTEQKHP